MNPPFLKPLTGVVEGFYGRPWTPSQRRTLLGWLAAAGLNAYLYAPKDDLKHRALWREPYDTAESGALQRLIGDTIDRGIEFIYAIAPGLDITFSRAEEVRALHAKLEQVRQWGARHLAVLWDDIPARLAAADEAAFGTAAHAQATLTAQVATAWRQSLPEARVLFCPTVYCGRMARSSVPTCPYLQELGERLPPDLDVLWTGPEIISETIPVNSLRELQRVLRRKPVLWDNLHANDYDVRRLYLGPYAGRAPELREEVQGILLNPNCPLEANFVPVRTLGRYLASSEPPPPRAAYLEALEAWLPAFATVGRHPLTLEELVLFADVFYLPGELGPRGRLLLEDFQRLMRTSPGGWGEAEARFEAACVQLNTTYEKLTELKDRDLLHALYPQAWETKEIALLLLGWLQWRRQHPEPDAVFVSPDHRPGIFRGGFAATLERLFPMDEASRFHSSPPWLPGSLPPGAPLPHHE